MIDKNDILLQAERIRKVNDTLWKSDHNGGIHSEMAQWANEQLSQVVVSLMTIATAMDIPGDEWNKPWVFDLSYLFDCGCLYCWLQMKNMTLEGGLSSNVAVSPITTKPGYWDMTDEDLAKDERDFMVTTLGNRSGILYLPVNQYGKTWRCWNRVGDWDLPWEDEE